MPCISCQLKPYLLLASTLLLLNSYVVQVFTLENLLLKEEISSIRQLPGFLLKLTFSFQERLPGLSPLHFSPKYQEDHEAKDEGSTVLFVLFLFLSSRKAAWTNRCWASYWVAWKGVSKNYKQRGTAQR